MLPKLVRDRIPELIRESGKDLRAHVADSTEFNNLIIEKMKEELAEFEESPCLDEAADIYEVFLTMLENWRLKLSDVKSVAKIKREIRGSFSRGIALDEIIDPPKER